MVKTSATDVVDRYSKALGSRDFPGARAFLADNLRFEGPIDTFDRADDYIKAISALYGMVNVLRARDPRAKAPVAEWYTVGAGGNIVRIRTYFDARPFARPSPTQS